MPFHRQNNHKIKRSNMVTFLFPVHTITEAKQYAGLGRAELAGPWGRAVDLPARSFDLMHPDVAPPLPRGGLQLNTWPFNCESDAMTITQLYHKATDHCMLTTFLPNAFHGCFAHCFASSSNSLIVRKRLSYSNHTPTTDYIPSSVTVTTHYYNNYYTYLATLHVSLEKTNRGSGNSHVINL